MIRAGPIAEALDSIRLRNPSPALPRLGNRPDLHRVTARRVLVDDADGFSDVVFDATRRERTFTTTTTTG